jgi:excinuclease ABC subunit A
MDVAIPLGVFTCVTGVSGSGKSTLIHDVLYAGLKKELEGLVDDEVGVFSGFGGSARKVKHAEMVDQSPIGRTPRSNPVTYLKAFDVIRELFSSTAAARFRSGRIFLQRAGRTLRHLRGRRFHHRRNAVHGKPVP